MEKVLRKNDGQEWYIVLLIHMAAAYVLSFLGLLITAFLLYKIRISERAVSVCMIIIYVGSTFMAGFLNGRKMKTRKFLWGLIGGVLYFLLLMILSWMCGGSEMIRKDLGLTLILCAGAGMLGGMIST